jgi:hypothetical protein
LVPNGTVEVPVQIDDNGQNYDVILYAGPMLATFTEGIVSTALDWALVDVTKSK